MEWREMLDISLKLFLIFKLPMIHFFTDIVTINNYFVNYLYVLTFNN